PDLLLLDEPLGALDAKLRAQLQLELKDIQKRTGKTFVFVTHDQDEALTMSDRIVVMNHGLVEQDGTPEDLYLRPQSRFVAQFIGETNLIEGTVRGIKNDAIVIDWNGIDLYSSAFSKSHDKGESVTASIRLEKIGIFDDQPVSGNAIQGHVINRVFKGSRTLVDLCIPGANDANLKTYVDPEAASKFTAERIWVGWDHANMAVLND
ncbi:MAG: ABC transporter ATP-binding protein, partial [Pseudomonadales bacterium]